jgi:glycosyltransferase involved in cell wall biosynthesis
MRVLQIDKFVDTGGVGRYVRTLGGLLRDLGWEVVRFGCSPPETAARDGRPAYRDFNIERGLRPLGRMIHNRQAAECLEAFLRDRPVDVAHLHNIYHHLTPAILPVLVRRGVGVVMTVHDYRLLCPTKHFTTRDGLCLRCLPNRFHHAASPRCAGIGGAGLAVESFFQRFFRRYERYVDAFLCPTCWLADAMRRAGYPAGKLRVVPNPVEPIEVVEVSAGHRPMLLYLGRMSPEKGPGRMLDLASAMPSADVVLAGDGPMLPELTAVAEDRGLGNVRFAGLIPPGELPALLGAASALVVPSRCMENSPAAMLEAMWGGRCAVVPDQPPLREWVDDGRTGRVFRTGDDGDLARVCDAVLRNDEARLRMARAGQDLVRRRHDPKRLTDAILDLYDEAVRRCAWR